MAALNDHDTGDGRLVHEGQGQAGGCRRPYGGRFYRIYRGFLELALRRRFVVLGATVGLVAAAGVASSTLVRTFFGPSDRNQFLIYLDLPAGSRVEATDEVTRRLTGWLNDKEINPEITSTVAYVGTGGPRFFLSLSPVDPDPHVAFAVVNTENGDQVPEVIQRTRTLLNDQFPSVNARVKQMWLGAAEPGYSEFRIIGPDIDHIYARGLELNQALNQLQGLDYGRIDWENRVPQVEVLVDQARARRAQVTSEEIAVSLSAFMDGREITQYREGDLAIPVVFQAEEEERNVLGDLWNVNVFSAQRGEMIPLTQVADITGIWQYSRIARRDQERTVTLEARHQTLKAPQLVAAMMPALEGLDLKPGHRWEIGGEVEDSAETNEKLFRYMPACILGIVVLLIWQFNSFRRPLIIMLTVPMAFAGALVGLIVLRAPFDFFGILGLLSLAGVIINNGIVLIDRIDGLRAENRTPHDAVIEAAVSRFRPILMSATTTMLGVLPLIILVDPLFYSMACVIAAGLGLGTVLTLVVVPVLYATFFRVKAAEG